MRGVPSNVREEIKRLRLDEKLGALAITNRLEQTFPNIKLPSMATLNRYLSAVDNGKAGISPIAVPANAAPAQVAGSTPNGFTPEAGGDLQQMDSMRAELIACSELSAKDPRAINEGLKRFYAAQIKDLTLKKANQIYVFDKDLEALLDKYAGSYQKLIQNEVKLADGLKDSEAISITEVQFAINKIITTLKLTLNKVCPEKTEQVMKELMILLNYVKSGVLTEEMLVGKTNDK